VDAVWRGIRRAIGVVACERDAGDSTPEECWVVDHLTRIPDAAIGSFVDKLKRRARLIANTEIISEIDAAGLSRCGGTLKRQLADILEYGALGLRDS
jgi:hypothetical protein